jgi:hypothetical protein
MSDDIVENGEKIAKNVQQQLDRRKSVWESDDTNLDLKDEEMFTEKSYSELYSMSRVTSPNILNSSLNYIKKYYKPSGPCAINYIKDRIPIIRWLPEYNFKQNIIADVISGITVIHLYFFI